MHIAEQGGSGCVLTCDFPDFILCADVLRETGINGKTFIQEYALSKESFLSGFLM